MSSQLYKSLYESLRLYAGVGQPTLLFDAAKPPLHLSGQLAVLDFGRFWDYGVDDAHHRERDVVVYLAVAAALQSGTRGRFSALVVDDAEAFALRHPPAWRLVVDHIRYSAYRNSAVWVVAVDSRRLGFDRPFVDSYMPHRLVFTPPGRSFYEPAPPHIEPAARLSQGECLWQQRRGRVRRIRVAAASPAAHQAALVRSAHADATCT